MRELDLFCILYTSFIYLELLFKLLFKYSLTISTFIYPLLLTTFLYLIIKTFNEKVEKILFYTFFFIITFLFGLQLCMYRMYNFYFDFGLLAAADQVGAFYKDIITLIISNIFGLLLIILPFVLSIIFRKHFNFKQLNLKYYLLIVPVISLLLFIFVYTPKNISTDVSIINNGVIGTFINDFKEKEKVELVIQEEFVEEIIEEEIAEEIKVPTYHQYEFDFDAAYSENSSIQELNEYFANSNGTLTNEYTGLFKNKNLILILAESFNDIGVSKDLTPNLYKMINGGFNFTNYYSSSYNSTLGGEFQLLNGMYAMSGSLDYWKQGSNYMPMGPGYMFKNNGYSVRAYHDHSYTYMNRNIYLDSVGFDNYIGCGNGFEEYMPCYIRFESDYTMSELTIDDYVNEDKFFTYYVTVSGHGPYSLDESQNVIGNMHAQEVYDAGYNYSEKVTAYLSSMIELDNMIGNIVNKLMIANKLDDTVFVIVGDHYPYYLTQSEIEELCGEYREETVGVCKNSLIIYNSSTPSVVCDKAGNTMDVIATIYNLFDIEYDSRMIPGKDLFSNAPGFALFGNGSWVSDYGIYYAHLGKFEPYENVEIEDNYFSSANSYAQSLMSLTNRIFYSDYYRYIWKYKK